MVIGITSYGEDYSAALKKTQELMKNQSLREQKLKDDKGYKQAMDKVNSLTGGDVKKNEQMMDLSSDVFGSLVNDQNGDIDAVKKLLDQGMRDPAGFLNNLPANQRERILKMADEIENGRRGSNN